MVQCVFRAERKTADFAKPAYSCFALFLCVLCSRVNLLLDYYLFYSWLLCINVGHLSAIPSAIFNTFPSTFHVLTYNIGIMESASASHCFATLGLTHAVAACVYVAKQFKVLMLQLSALCNPAS